MWWYIQRAVGQRVSPLAIILRNSRESAWSCVSLRMLRAWAAAADATDAAAAAAARNVRRRCQEGMFWRTSMTQLLSAAINAISAYPRGLDLISYLYLTVSLVRH